MKTKHPQKVNTNAYLILAYVALVLGVDLLATFGTRVGIDWSWLQWTRSSGFDWYKFIFWLIVPLLISLRTFDWQYLGIGRWTRSDVLLLLALIGAGLVAVLLIPKIPELDTLYRDQSGLPAAQKWRHIRLYLMWDLSWLPGWEFLHRYVLLRAVSRKWVRFGWVLVPLSEGLYHVPKSLVEAAGMVLFSIVATQWTLRRRNMLLPLIAHGAIEIALLFALFA